MISESAECGIRGSRLRSMVVVFYLRGIVELVQLVGGSMVLCGCLTQRASFVASYKTPYLFGCELVWLPPIPQRDHAHQHARCQYLTDRGTALATRRIAVQHEQHSIKMRAQQVGLPWRQRGAMRPTTAG